MPFLGPFKKLSQSLKERGAWETVIQLYTIGEIKLGTLKGVDAFGNKYYENLDFPYGQHRWIEYKDIHNFDASNIQPEWHGWIHHTFDEPPTQPASIKPVQLHDESNAIYKDHVGLAYAEPQAQVNQSTYRQRGYKVGSLMVGPNDQDKYYKQPGHPLSDDVDKGRFQYTKSLKPYLDAEKTKEEKK